MVSGGRSVSTGASASIQVSLVVPISSRPSSLRTVLCPPSQPTSHEVRRLSSVPSARVRRTWTPSVSCRKPVRRVFHSISTPSRATAARSTASVSVWATISVYGYEVGIVE
jgi:hypothetical protein